MPENLPRWVTFEFDARFALFCLAITGTATVLFALLPAIQASGVPARDAMQEGGRTSGSRRHTFTLRGLVVAEVALALAVLVAAGLVLQGFRAVSRVDPGFRAEGVLTFTVSLPAARYPNDKPQLRVGFFDRRCGVRPTAESARRPLSRRPRRQSGWRRAPPRRLGVREWPPRSAAEGRFGAETAIRRVW